MKTLHLVNDYALIPVWKKFSAHLHKQVEPQSLTDAYVNAALAEYRAVYYQEDVGNIFESDILHWIEFEDEELYAWFLLRWS